MPARPRLHLCLLSILLPAQHTHGEVKPRPLVFLPRSTDPGSSRPGRLCSLCVLPMAVS